MRYFGAVDTRRPARANASPRARGHVAIEVSAREVAMTVTHAGIAAVIEYDLIPPDAVPDQRMRIER
jgi:hypothetical protein